MKRINILGLIILISTVLLACAKWGGNNPVGVTGGVTSWDLNSSDQTGGPSAALTGSWRYDNYYSDYYEIMTFGATGNFSVYINDAGDENTIYGTYSVSGNHLNIVINGQTITFTFYIDGNELTLYSSDGDSQTYYRIQKAVS